MLAARLHVDHIGYRHILAELIREGVCRTLHNNNTHTGPVLSIPCCPLPPGLKPPRVCQMNSEDYITDLEEEVRALRRRVAELEEELHQAKGELEVARHRKVEEVSSPLYPHLIMD